MATQNTLTNFGWNMDGISIHIPNCDIKIGQIHSGWDFPAASNVVVS